MVRLTKKVFSDLAIWMMGFGMLVGIIFPFFMVVLGMERAVAFTWWFFAVCITAGLFVGAVNIYLARIIVGSRILLLSKHMQTIESHLKSVAGKNERMDCTPDNCHIPVDSEDAIGRSSAAFNSLVTTLASSLQLEMEIRSFTRMLTSHLETNDLCKEALSSLLEMFSLPAGAILVESNGDLQLCSSSGLVESERIRENHLVLETL